MTDAARSMFVAREMVTPAQLLNVRISPGYLGKPANDVVGMVAPMATLAIDDGPAMTNDLIWWRVAGVSINGDRVFGWCAESVNGTSLLGKIKPEFLIAMPFSGDYPITQFWGENPEVYDQYVYDGVPLKGHNGIDWGLPTGIDIRAVAPGVVIRASLNRGSYGFGAFVLLRHAWGESLYAHMDTVSIVSGQSVHAGILLGTSGDTGNSTGPHLHFSIKIDPNSRTDGWGGYSDPLPYFRKN